MSFITNDIKPKFEDEKEIGELLAAKKIEVIDLKDLN